MMKAVLTRHNFPLLCLFCLTSLAAIVGVALGPRDADDWSFMGYLSEFQQDNVNMPSPFLDLDRDLDVRPLVSPWLYLVAAVQKLTRIDTVSLYRVCIPPVLAGLSILVIFLCGWRVSGNKTVGLVAGILWPVYFASTAFDKQLHGSIFFMRIQQDKALVAVILLPALMLTILRFLDTGSKRHGVLLGVLALMLPFVSTTGPVLAGLFFLPFLVIEFVFQKGREYRRRVAVSIAAIVASLLLLLALKLVLESRMPVLTASYSLSSSPWGARHIIQLFDGMIITSPRLVLSPLGVLGLVCVPLLLARASRMREARFCLVILGMTLLTSYNPLVLPLIGRVVPYSILFRLTWMFPLASVLALSLAVREISAWVSSRVTAEKAQSVARKRPTLAVLLVLSAIGLATPWVIRSARWVAANRASDIDLIYPLEEELEVLAFLSRSIPDGEREPVVIAPYRMNFFIPTYAGQAAVLDFRFSAFTSFAPGSDEGYDRREVVRSVFPGKTTIDWEVLAILRRYHVEYVVLTASSGLAESFAEVPSIATPVFGNSEYQVYALSDRFASMPTVSFDFVRQLDEAAILSPQPAYVSRGTFEINGDPRGVLFEHPPRSRWEGESPSTEITYTITIPSAAVVKFGIALKPEAWDQAKGDGVTFGIFVDDGNGRRPVFWKYIDPKNRRLDRKWFDEEIDLAEFVGKEVKISFVTWPGPAGDDSCDWAGWSSPLLLSRSDHEEEDRADVPATGPLGTFADQFQLLDASLADVGEEFGPGDVLEVELYWKVLERTMTNYRVFVHLYDMQGNLVAQHDSEPCMWHCPTSAWEEGEIIRDFHLISLPKELKPGRYVLRVGLYELVERGVESPWYNRLPVAESHFLTESNDNTLPVIPIDISRR